MTAPYGTQDPQAPDQARLVQDGHDARRHRVGAHLAIPAGCATLLLIGAITAAAHGAVSGGWVLVLATIVVAAAGMTAEPGATLFVVCAAWLTVAGFSRPPYAQLQVTWLTGARAALVLSLAGLIATVASAVVRKLASSVTLGVVETGGRRRPSLSWWRQLGPAGGMDRKRQFAGLALVAVLPLLTAVLVPAQAFLSLSDDLLIYLVGVVAVAVVGGFWPAVVAAVAASLLLNWFFTPPVHTFTIEDPQNMLALLLFITVAVTVSSVVHLAARRAVQAARSREDAAALLELAQTVLGGQDTPAAILDHLTATWGGGAELAERVGGQWVRVAASGTMPSSAQRSRVRAGADLMLAVAGQPVPVNAQLLDGFAAQAAAALERDRLRTQAAQAEALAEGNRMRTALLAAVSHDLRTPLASIKASISTLRQTGLQLSADDEAALLATTEESADRLNDLIGNLLDMSRLAAGSLEPFLRPASIDEVAPLARHDAESSGNVRLVVPDDLPLVRTDPGLLERVLANLFANAIAHSPPGRPPVMTASRDGEVVLLDVVDHGTGVTDDLKPLMFEPFERLGERGGGTGVGLGLAVAKGFLSAMGGTVTPVDTPGGGLTMRVTLPVAAPASTRMAADQ
ncbi:MAG: sensor histidine kinase [Streptosporangiaceae bacterium]